MKMSCIKLTCPKNENFKLPSSISFIACGFWPRITEQMILAIPVGLTHNGIPFHSNCRGVVFINSELYRSPNTSDNWLFKMPNCGGIVLSAIWSTDFHNEGWEKVISKSKIISKSYDKFEIYKFNQLIQHERWKRLLVCNI